MSWQGENSDNGMESLSTLTPGRHVTRRRKITFLEALQSLGAATEKTWGSLDIEKLQRLNEPRKLTQTLKIAGQ